jgi:hypothetical protein
MFTSYKEGNFQHLRHTTKEINLRNCKRYFDLISTVISTVIN